MPYNAETDKLQTLTRILNPLPSLAVAFSGGVDSTFLLKAAKTAVNGRVVAITARSVLFPEREVASAADFCKVEGIEHILIFSDELNKGNFADNPQNRCYICKKALFAKIKAAALEIGITDIAEGSNADDTQDYRPGLTAIAEEGILSPLREAKLTKEEIRALSRTLNLPTWNKPSFACLASRFPYGERITTDALSRIDSAERFILGLGVRQVRVRFHKELARIETDADGFDILAERETREKVNAKLKELGFTYVSLDLQGYRTGSMNDTL